MKQVFVDDPCMLHASISLDPKQAHHLFDVLRIQKKETIRVVSKKGGTFLAHPLDKPYLYVFDEIEVPRSAKHITLCASLIKQDRFELMLQKACELGVTKIVPFTSAYSIIRIDPKKIDKKKERWQQIIFDACKQCNRNDLVELEAIQNIETLHNYQQDCNLVCYEKQNDPSFHISHLLKRDPASVTIVIGPEGGFDVNEIDILQDDHFIPVSLGNRILRAETAAFYALSCIDYQHSLSKEEK